MTDQQPIVGSTIRYRAFTGIIRTVRVTATDPDIKNGRAGFDGVIVRSTSPDDRPDDPVWGYTDQIV